MEEAPGAHYMMSAFKRQYADRVPVTLLPGPYISRTRDYTLREFYTDARKSAEAHLAFYDRYKPDSLIVYNHMYSEVEALGCEIEFPEDGIPYPKRYLLEDKSDLAKLKLPDPAKDGRLPDLIDTAQRVASQVQNAAAVSSGGSGPWNIAVHLRGAEELLVDTATDPGFVHEVMKFSTEVVKTIGDSLMNAGFAPGMGEASASCSLISPQIYRDFIKPYHAEICNHRGSKGFPATMHICGYIDPMLEDVVETGISLLSLDALSSLQKLVELTDGKLVIMGNVKTDLYAFGERREMEEAIRNCIETAAEGSGFILCSGCEIPADSKEDMVDHYFRYGREYSREYMSRLQERKPELFDQTSAE